MRYRLAVLVVPLALLTGCGGASTGTAAATATQTPVDTDTAYLQAVKPSLTADHGTDRLGLLQAGRDVCGISDTYAIDLLQRADGYNLTEATAIDQQARKHLCG